LHLDDGAVGVFDIALNPQVLAGKAVDVVFLGQVSHSNKVLRPMVCRLQVGFVRVGEFDYRRVFVIGEGLYLLFGLVSGIIFGEKNNFVFAAGSVIGGEQGLFDFV